MSTLFPADRPAALRPPPAQRAQAEQACKDKSVTLYVLPPKRPQLNGAVERNRGAWRYEFYASFDLPYRIDKLQPLVGAFAHRCNQYRPHQALGHLTPAAHLATISSGAPASHMT